MAVEEETGKNEALKLIGVGALVASSLETVIAFLYLLLLTFGDRFPRNPNVQFNIADDLEFVAMFLLPVPLFLLFITGFILGIVGRRSWQGIAALSLAIVSPICQAIWFLAVLH